MLALLPRAPGDQMADISGITLSRAAQACATCRKQKRKCDKLLPACSRCASLQRTCDYAEAGAPAVPTAEDFAALQSKLVEIEARLNTSATLPSITPAASSGNAGTSEHSPENNANGLSWTGTYGAVPAVRNNFPGVLFLDVDMYKFAGTIPPKPIVDIPIVSKPISRHFFLFLWLDYTLMASPIRRYMSANNLTRSCLLRPSALSKCATCGSRCRLCLGGESFTVGFSVQVHKYPFLSTPIVTNLGAYRKSSLDV